LHRLYLSGEAGRPAGLVDDGCLRRLAEKLFCRRRDDGRFELTPAGTLRHAEEVLKGRER
jgi:hypothetical protein